VSRFFFHFFRTFFRVFEATVPRIYMHLYSFLLKLYGVKFNGEPRYISSGAKFDDFNLVELGERVVISSQVTLLTHDYSLTTGLIAINQMPDSDYAFKKTIIIGNNVFIGMGVLLLPGTNIGDNVIVAAGSVVRGVIPEDSIVLGNPGEVVGKLSEKAHKWHEKLASSNVVID